MVLALKKEFNNENLHFMSIEKFALLFVKACEQKKTNTAHANAHKEVGGRVCLRVLLCAISCTTDICMHTM